MYLKKIIRLVLLLLCLQTNTFAQTKVVCVGNSITEGYGLSYGQKPWPAQLGDLLGGGYNVINRGRSGFAMLKSARWGDGSTRSYWDTDTYQYAKNDRPDILILALGTNDSAWDVWSNAQSFRNDYIDMINEFKAINNNVKVYACFPPYIYDAGQNNTLEQYVIPAIQQAANATGATIINLHDITANHRNDLYNDALHPNVNGAGLLARTIYGTISQTAANITPYAQDKYGWRQLSELSITVGETFSLGPQAAGNGTWSWTGPNGFTSNQREFTINNATVDQDGTYVATFTDANGQKSTANILVHVWSWTAPAITPYVNDGSGWKQDTQATVNVGGNFTAGPQEANNYDNAGQGTWMWTGVNGFTSNQREIALNNITADQAGTYTVTFSDQFGRRAIQDFQIAVNGNNNNNNNNNNTPVNTGNGPAITPYVRNSYGDWYRDDVIQVSSGSSFAFGPQVANANNWYWTGPNGFTSNQREITFNNVSVNQAGTYRLTHTSQNGEVSVHEFKVSVDGRTSNAVANPAYPANAIADASYNAFNDAFLMTDGGNGRVYYREGYKGTAANYRLYCWDQGLVIMMLQDRYRFRGDESLKPLISKVLDSFTKNETANDLKAEGVVPRSIHEKYHNSAQADVNISDWTWNAFSDDLLWMSLPYARGYLITGEKRFLDQAIWTWDYLYERAWDNEMGGGYWWNWDNQAKSGLSNNPAICLGVYLYEATGDKRYLEQAKKTYDWVYQVLRNADGAVDENINIETTNYPRRVNGYNAYNEGTFIEGAAGLYRVTGEQKYLDAAIQTLNWVMTNDVNGDGIISRAKSDGTYQSELARGAAFLLEVAPDLWNTPTTYGTARRATTYYEWLRKNADAAWNTRDRNYNLTGCQWAVNTNFDPNSTVAKLHTEVFVSSVVMDQVVPANNPGNNRQYLGQNTAVTPYLVKNNGGWQQTSKINVNRGDNVTFGPQPNDNANWTWKGPNGFTANSREVTLNNIQQNQEGVYTASYVNQYGRVLTQNFAVTMEGVYDANIVITPYVSDAYGWQQSNRVGINVGENFSVGPQANVDGNWSWTGPNGFTSNQREFTIYNANQNQAGTYTVTVTTADGRMNKTDIQVNVLNTAKPNIISYLMGNNGWQNTNELYLNTGNNFSAGPQVANVSETSNTSWAWTGPNGFTAANREFTRTNVNNGYAGTYTVYFTDLFGRRAAQNITIHVDGYAWAQAAIPFEDEQTGIKEVEADNKAYDIYDLQGRKVSTPVAGQIYIVNGHKVIVKP